MKKMANSNDSMSKMKKLQKRSFKTESRNQNIS